MTYDRSSLAVTRAQAAAQTVGALTKVGRLPLGQTFEGVRGATVPSVIYLHEWDGHYVEYALSGGP